MWCTLVVQWAVADAAGCVVAFGGSPHLVQDVLAVAA